MHATGLYPDWWEGHRFEKAPRIWAGGVTAVTVRDVIQRKLLGPPGAEGTGWLPKESIEKVVPSRGVPGAADYVIVKHKSGGTTVILFKSYEQGREKWMADTVDFLWFDEEPPEEIWTEGLARTTAVRGQVQLTFTPLKGMSTVVRSFYPVPDSPEKWVTRMGIKDAAHISEADRESILMQYPKHERDARAEGIPMLGSGAVYTVPEDVVRCPPFQIPPHFARIVGMDFGRGDHPTTAVALAHNRDEDIVYAYQSWKEVDPRIDVHVGGLRNFGDFPVAWPKDGHSREQNEGMKIADVYRQKGIRMNPEHAQFMDGSVSVEAGIHEINSRMQDGRFKIFYTLGDVWDEYRMYHRDKGKIVKQFDDVLDAMRYAYMDLRYARAKKTLAMASHVFDYDPFSYKRRQDTGYMQ